MKKYSYLVFIAILCIATPSIYAANTNQGSQNATQTRMTIVTSVTPQGTGTATQNENQVRTQNEGEETNLQVSTEEKENEGEKIGTKSGNRSAVAIEHMSEVAKQVHILLETKGTGGIGEQVRQIAREQNQAQLQVEEHLSKLVNRSTFKLALFGPDYQAIKRLKTVIEENQLRIEKLQELLTQLTNQGDNTAIQETIQALEQENIALQDLVDAGEQTRSMFGWLLRLFIR